MTTGTKLERVFILGTKNGKIKKLGPKWKYGENVETKIVFLPVYRHDDSTKFGLSNLC